MKKAMTLILAMWLALSLWVPALAAEEETPPLPDRWLLEEDEDAWEDEEEDAYAAYEAAHPEELAALDADALLAGWDYRDQTAEERFMAYREEATLEEAVKREYIENRLLVEDISAEAEEYRAEYPEEWAAFDPDRYFAEDYNNTYPYRDYDDKADYMAYWNILTDEEFADDMFVFYINGLDGEDEDDYDYDYDYDYDWYDWEDEEPRPAPRLVVNGAVVTDAGFMTEEGVSYVTSAWLDGTLGTSYAETEAGAEAPPEGYFMVPLRQAAEDAGWDVGWNEEENAVFLLDGATLKAQLRESLTALDAMVGWAQSQNQSQGETGAASTLNCKADLKLLDSLNGDRDGAMTAAVTALVYGGVGNYTVTVDAAGLAELFTPGELAALESVLPGLADALGDVRADLIVNLEDGTISVNCPALALLTGSLEDAGWYTEDLDIPERDTAAGLRAIQGYSDWVVEYLYDSLVRRSGYWWNSPESAFADFDDNCRVFAALFGPDTLTEEAGVLTWALTTQRVNELCKEMVDAPLGADTYQSMEARLVMKPDGSYTLDMDLWPTGSGLGAALYQWIESDYYPYYYSDILWDLMDVLPAGQSDVRLTVHWAGSAGQSAGTVDYHQKNSFQLHLDVDTKSEAAQEEPVPAPPEPILF